LIRPYCLRDGDKRVAETCDFLNSKSTVVHPETDPKDPYKPAHTGTFVRAVTVSKKARGVVYYVPERYPASGEAVFLFPDDGETSAGFLETHAEWKELSEERCVLSIMLLSSSAIKIDSMIPPRNGKSIGGGRRRRFAGTRMIPASTTTQANTTILLYPVGKVNTPTRRSPASGIAARSPETECTSGPVAMIGPDPACFAVANAGTNHEGCLPFPGHTVPELFRSWNPGNR
jgi:hypothetical protein